jgi:hypothetical protein
MRINNLLAVHRWGLVAMAMPRMQADLARMGGLRDPFKQS